VEVSRKEIMLHKNSIPLVPSQTSAYPRLSSLVCDRRYLGDLLVITLGAFGLLGVLVARAASPTTTTLALSSSSVATGTVVTFTASVSNGSPVKAGIVTFCDATATYCENSAAIGTAQLTSTGTATINRVPGIGIHSYKAVFSATTANLGSASSAQSLTVTGLYPTTTTISSSGSPGNYTLTATVVGKGTPTLGPTGSVSFVDTTNSNYVLGSATLGAATMADGLAAQVTYPAGTAPQAVAVGDFDGDGKLELLVANPGSNNVGWLEGNGNGSFNAPVNNTTGSGTSPRAIAVGDFNGDGKLDFAVANYGNDRIGVFLGNGNGTFQAQVTYASGDKPQGIAVGDFNRDGHLDLAVASSGTGAVVVMLGDSDGDGTFPTQVSYPTGTTPSSVAVADLNGDGYLDLVVTNSGSNTVSVLLGKGDGTFQTAVPYTTGTNPQSVAIGDFNGDGKLDFVVANKGSNSVSVFLADIDGDGTFLPKVDYVTGGSPYNVAIADIDADGRVELAVTNSGSDTVSVLEGNGDGTFQPKMDYGTGTTPYGLAIGDFNGDGLADLVVVNSGTTTAGVLLSNITQTATAAKTGVSIPGSGTAHLLDASYPGNSNFSSSTSSTIPLTTSLQSTTLTLTASQSNVPNPEPIVLTATLNPSTLGDLTTSGETVTFKNGAATLGTASLNSLGVATLALPITTTTPPLGATAIYLGDTDFAGSTSNALPSVVIPVLTVSAFNVNYVSGSGNLPSLTYAITGFVNGDTQSVVSGAPSLTTAATKNSPAGTYPIIAALGTLAAPGYSFAFENASLTITSSNAQSPNIQGRWEFAITSGDTATQFAATGQSTFSTYLLQPTSGTTLTNIQQFTTDTVACDSVSYNNVTVSNSSIDAAGNVTVTFTVTEADQSTFQYVFTGVLGIGPPEVITGTYQRSSGGCTQGSLGVNGTPDGYFVATYFADLSGTWAGAFDYPNTGTGPTGVPATFTLTTNADKTLSGTVSAPLLTNSGGTACLAGPVTLQTGMIEGVSEAAGAFFQLFGTDANGTRLWVLAGATNPDGSVSAVGEDDPADGSNGTVNDGTNATYTAYYGITGGPCDGLGGGDAPFQLVKKGHATLPEPRKKHHGNAHHRYHNQHHHHSEHSDQSVEKRGD
jgi:hypothetical protein